MDKIVDILIRLVARGIKKLLSKSASRSKRVARLVEVMADEDVLELMKTGGAYLAKKSSNTIDDKLVAQLSKQTTMPSGSNTRKVNRTKIK